MELGRGLLVVVEESTDDHEVGGENGKGAKDTEQEAGDHFDFNVERHVVLLDAFVLKRVAAETEH